MDFVLGGFSAACAGFFSNPFDVIKTRQQLQGEMVSIQHGIKDLQLKAEKQKQPYKNIFQSIKSIVKSEGIRGLQKGLPSALAFQFCMNSVRLGTYQTIDNYGYNRNTNGELNPGLCILWGGISGIFGSTVGCPLYMIKTQMQAQSYGKYAVGFQHGHKSTLDAFKRILAESGVRGLWRGWTGILARTSVGSSVQLSTFSKTKDFLIGYEVFAESIVLTAFTSSILSGFYTSLAMNPFDTIATRMFNQGVNAEGKGLLYKNLFDCFVKTIRVEGLLALYKGFTANYMRIAPHTILNLTFWDLFKNWKDLYYDSVVYLE
ncbi:solute carrier family 25 member 35-like isoform X1 [Chironomus tepperi]|uniref:solute carrier family 25 member 35-like isoform X1 n=2 Tax=Chironomus tepperi TaxID=113505 RepID=UPI00391F71D9